VKRALLSFGYDFLVMIFNVHAVLFWSCLAVQNIRILPMVMIFCHAHAILFLKMLGQNVQKNEDVTHGYDFFSQIMVMIFFGLYPQKKKKKKKEKRKRQIIIFLVSFFFFFYSPF